MVIKVQKYFNTEGRCKQDIHYMVRLDERLDNIKRLFVDREKYFIINKGRQYGKTTTLMALAEYLKSDYAVLFIDFQMISSASFLDEKLFIISFIEYIEELISTEIKLQENIDIESLQNLIDLKDNDQLSFDKLFRGLSKLCQNSKKSVVMMIDEIDSASNHQVFLDFLAMLRGYYLIRDKRPTFHSVIFAGVYDIKNLKLKLRPESEHQYNSPWNIAAEFSIEMDFSIQQITDMLEEYKLDYQKKMDTWKVAEEIYQYTSGYPYLVSAICKILDEKMPYKKEYEQLINIWSKEGVSEAVKILLKENIPLFDSMIKQLDTYDELRNILEEILYKGRKISFSPAEKSINLGIMFGFLKEKDGYVAISNRIFEMYLLNLFIAEESIKSEIFLYGQSNRNQFITDSGLDMDKVLEKFVLHFSDIYGDNDEKFIEEYGRKFFLLYLKPIINGVGNYYIEAQTRDARRTDIIVDYFGKQFIIELKIWHGNEYNERGEKQLSEYLEYYHINKGYLLSFNFNKKKETGIKKIKINDKIIVEAVV